MPAWENVQGQDLRILRFTENQSQLAEDWWCPSSGIQKSPRPFSYKVIALYSTLLNSDQ